MPDDASSQSPSSGRGGGDNWLTRRHGPLPTWAWIAIPVGGVAVYLIYKKVKSGSTSTTAATTTTTAGATGATGSTGSTGRSGANGTSGATSWPWTNGAPPTTATSTTAASTPATTPSPTAVPASTYSYSTDPNAVAITNAYQEYLGAPPTAAVLQWRLGLIQSGQDSLQSQLSDIASAASNPNGGGGGYGETSHSRLAPLNAQLATRPHRGSGGGSGAGAATASTVPAVVNPPAQAAPVQPNVTWSGLNTNVEKGESTI